MPDILIVVNQKGDVVIDVMGAKGRQCAKLVKPLVDSIGEVSQEEKKPVYYQETALI